MPRSQPFRWGLIAPGRIAHNFAQALAVIPAAELTAVASSNPARGQAFADAYTTPHQTPRVYQSYEALCLDPDLDAVYIANPHRFHAECIELCLAHNKPVLCEKPLTVTAIKAEALFEEARQRGLFVMEALWSRFLPVWVQVEQWLKAGAIGHVHTVQSDFCFDMPRPPTDRLYDIEQAGGTLLDMGVYPISLSNFVFGRPPERIQSAVLKGTTGVDVRTTGLLSYGTAVSVFTCGFLTQRDNTMRIEGDAGVIVLDGPFWGTTKATLTPKGDAPQTFDEPFRANGFEYQIEAAMADIEAGRLQNDRIPWEDTLATARVMDKILYDGDIRYPFL